MPTQLLLVRIRKRAYSFSMTEKLHNLLDQFIMPMNMEMHQTLCAVKAATN
jgi:hypothetical protein